MVLGAALLRAMPPSPAPPEATIPGTPVILLSGDAAPFVPAETAARLAATLKGAGAEVTHQVLPTGHGLSSPDLSLTHRFLAGLSAPAA